MIFYIYIYSGTNNVIFDKKDEFKEFKLKKKKAKVKRIILKNSQSNKNIVKCKDCYYCSKYG